MHVAQQMKGVNSVYVVTHFLNVWPQIVIKSIKVI